MKLVASGLVVSVILGALAMGILIGLTRRRRLVLLMRGRAERAIEYGAGVLGGLLVLLALMVANPEVTPASQAAALVGIVLAMPVSAVATWLAGELLAGPTKGNWLPLVLACFAAQAGFVAPMAIFPWFDRHILSAFVGEANALSLSAALLISFLLGGLASAWTYRRSRNDIVVC